VECCRVLVEGAALADNLHTQLRVLHGTDLQDTGNGTATASTPAHVGTSLSGLLHPTAHNHTVGTLCQKMACVGSPSGCHARSSSPEAARWSLSHAAKTSQRGRRSPAYLSVHAEAIQQLWPQLSLLRVTCRVTTGTKGGSNDGFCCSICLLARPTAHTHLMMCI
jgi:hypothetical protein